jgi:hypothetical protein
MPDGLELDPGLGGGLDVIPARRRAA